MTELHVYASANDLKAYLTDPATAQRWNPDEDVVRRVLEAASEQITGEMGGRHFGPVTRTNQYDLGNGRLRSSALMGTGRPLGGELALGGIVDSQGRIDLRDWLITPTTVNAYTGSDRSGGATVLSEASGGSGDFLLEPYNESPKTTLKLFEETVESLSGGQQTFEVVGVWGWQNRQVATGATVASGDWASGATSVSVTAGGGAHISAGMVLLIDTEQVYVRSAQGDVLTVERALNGTTAAAHTSGTTITRYIYPADVVDACLQIAANLYRRRTPTATAQTGADGQPGTIPQASARTVLMSLKHYKTDRSRSGVYF